MSHAERFELTHPQRRVMSVEVVHPGTPMFNVGGHLKIYGLVDASLLAQAISEFVARHSQLRMRLVRDPSGVKQHIVDVVEPVRTYTHDRTDEEVERELARGFEEPFALFDGPLYRFSVHQTRTTTYFDLALHHILCDGWSVRLVVGQVRQAYERLVHAGSTPAVETPRYLELLDFERDYMASAAYADDERFWNERVSIDRQALLRPTQHTEAERVEHELGLERSSRLKAFCRTHRLQLGSVLLGSFGAAVTRFQGTRRVCMGLPRLNRYNARQRATFGMFTNIMLMDVEAGAESFGALFRSVDEEMKARAKHQKYPFDAIGRRVQRAVEQPCQLYEYSFNLYAGDHGLAFDGFRAQSLEVFSGHQPVRLSLGAKEWNDSGLLTAFIDHGRSEHQRAEAADLWAEFVRLLDVGIDDPNRNPRESLPVRAGANGVCHGRVAAFPREASVWDLFERTVAEFPEHIAVRAEERTYTFRELRSQARRLCRRLSERGVRAGDAVGLIGPHSLDLVVAFLALARLGAVCVPMDLKAPPERLRSIEREARLALVLTSGDSTGIFSSDVLALGVETGDEANGPTSAGGEHPLYMIFTSGSTGVPKGVLVSNRTLLNYLSWAQSYYLSPEGDTFALYSSIAFDLTLTSIYLPLVTGQQIVVYDSSRDAFVLDRVFRDDLCTIVKLTPSHLSLVDAGIAAASRRVRLLIVGGERFEAELAARVHRNFGGRVRQVNEYGPTEATIGCTYHTFDIERDARDAAVPIGVPIDNVSIHLLDADRQPVRAGEVGEVFIGGECLALGYFGNSELTRERFIGDEQGVAGRLYESGDRAFVNRAGQLQYVGRADRGTKFLGYRIEPEEIEAALLRSKGVRQAYVTVADRRGGAELLAFIGAPGGGFEERAAIDSLKQVLPPYMIPTRFVVLDELPLNLNGKVDAERLPRAKDQAEPAEVGGGTGELLALGVRKVLGVESVAWTDNFFGLGGDSVTAIQLATWLQGRGLILQVRDILSFPELHRMRELIRSGASEDDEDDAPLPSIAPTPIVRWLLERDPTSIQSYAQSVILSLDSDREPAQLAQLIETFVRAVPILRTRLEEDGSLTPSEPVSAPMLSVGDARTESEQITVERLMLQARDYALQLDPRAADLVRATLLRVSERRYLLLMVVHHIAVDVVSWYTIAAELSGVVRTGSVNVRRARQLYRTHARWANELGAAASELVRQGRGWSASTRESRLKQASSGAEARGCVNSELLLDGDTTAMFLSVQKHSGVRPLEALAAAVARAAGSELYEGGVPLELESHGRETELSNVDVNPCIGWFTALYPLNLPIGSTLEELVRHAKDMIRRATAHAVEYGLLKYLGGIAFPDQPRVRLNFLGQLGSGDETQPVVVYRALGLEPDDGDEPPMGCCLELLACVSAGRLRLVMRGSHRQLGREQMDRFASALERAIREVVGFCSSAAAARPTGSDFDAADLSEQDLEALIT